MELLPASEEAEIAGKRKPRTQPTNPPAKFLQRCAERTQKTARRSGVKFGGIIQTASEDEGLLARKGIERRRQAPRTNSEKLCKCVQKTLHTLKKHDDFVVFFSGAADDKERRGDCLQEETPSAGDERSARL